MKKFFYNVYFSDEKFDEATEWLRENIKGRYHMVRASAPYQKIGTTALADELTVRFASVSFENLSDALMFRLWC